MTTSLNQRIRRAQAAETRRMNPKSGDDQVSLWMLRFLVLPDMCWRVFDTDSEWSILPPLRITPNNLHSTRRQARATEVVAAAQLAEMETSGAPRRHPVFTNVEHLGSLVHLDAVSKELLAFSVLARARSPLLTCMTLMVADADGNEQRLCESLAHVLAVEPDSVRGALEPKGGLARAGLLTFSFDRTRVEHDPFEVSELADSVLMQMHVDAAALVAKLVEIAPPAELSLVDFDHLGQDMALVRGYVDRALRQRLRGVNILVHGVPGAGKTQFVRAVARNVRGELYQVNVANPEGAALRRSGRFESFQLCQALLQDRPDALVLFDEVEDAFPCFFMELHSKDPGREKGWVNRLLEENPVPAFWLTNHIEQIDPAYLRRFDIVLELKVPPRRVRRDMLARHLDGIPVGERWLDRCSLDDDITPADMARAAKVVRVLAPIDRTLAEAQWGKRAASKHLAADPAMNESRLDRLLANQLLVRRGPKPAAYRRGPGDYHLDCVNTDLDLEKLLNALRKRQRGTVCMYGPPGTGKTAFAQWLAEQLDMPLVHKRASDLLSKFVGEAEKNIAAMFREATNSKAVLLLDEADSFLQNRKNAHHSWEITQVNELLVQMEAYDGLFLCATNLLDQLDEAAFRRFSFKVKFSVLTEAQRGRMLMSTLKELGAPAGGGLDAEASTLEGVTLGDFAAVTKQYKVLEHRPTLAELAEALRGELAFRAPVRRAVGFLN